MFKNAYFYGLFMFLTTLVQAQDTNIVDFGAKSDGVTINTEAIQKAINQTAVKGGTVLIPQGEFLSGTIYLKSNVTLYIQKGGMLKGSPNLKDYPENRMFGDNLPAYGFYLRHVQNIYFNNIQFTLQGKDNRPAFHIEDAANIQIRDCKVAIPENKQPVLNVIDVNGLYVSNIFDTKPIPLLFHVSGTKSGRIKVANESKKSLKYSLDKGVSKDVFIE